MSSARECRLLAYLAAQTPPGGDVVEIGAWMGKSTAWLVEGAQKNPAQPGIVSIDPHLRNTWETFRRTVEEFALEQRGLQVRRAMSHDAAAGWTRPISLLWVDGCHEYDAVRQDIDDFVPHVIAGGWVVFDDAACGVFPGVEQAIAERMLVRRDFKRVATIRHLMVFQRQS
jgi:predicted O-methyltransferase YrrM